MKKKGFTLVELLGVIIILGILSLIVFPIVLGQLKKSKSEIGSAKLKLFSTATSLYLSDRTNTYAYFEGDNYCVSLKTLIEEGYLQRPLIDENGDAYNDANFMKAVVKNKMDITYTFVTTCKEVNQNPSIPDEPDEPLPPIIADVTPPVLTVPGNETIDAYETTYNILEGVTYTDDTTPNGKLNFTVSGSVSLGIPGTYPIIYRVEDEAGNFTVKHRTITIDVFPKQIVTADLNGATFYNHSKNLLSTSTTVGGTAGFAIVGTGSVGDFNSYLRVTMDVDLTHFNKLNFSGRKIVNHGIIAIYIDGVSKLSIGYNDLTSTWTNYAVDVSSYKGVHSIAFVGGYFDASGSTASRTEYSNISFTK